MTSVPSILQELLRGCTLWGGSGTIQLVADWKPLREVAKVAPAETGVYTLGVPCPLNYPNGCSRVIYIGSSETLANRLTRHASQPHNNVIGLLKDIFPPDLLASLWVFPKLPTKWLRTIEGETLWSFEHDFGTVPLANLDIPESKLRDGYSGLVTVSPCQQTEDSLSLETLAKKVGCVLRIEETVPRGDPGQVSLSFGADTHGNLAVLGRYKAARLIPLDVVERERKDAIEALCWIKDEYVGAWSVEKMKGVIDVCRTLTPIKTRAKTIKPFEAPFRDIPEPHTWGEVALIQGRIITGCWYPATRHRIRVLHAGELLGEATLCDWWFDGTDRSDAPQRKEKRTSFHEICEPLPVPTFREDEQQVESRTDGVDECGEEYTEVTVNYTEEARARMDTEWEEYTEKDRQRLIDAIENTFLLAQASGGVSPNPFDREDTSNDRR